MKTTKIRYDKATLTEDGVLVLRTQGTDEVVAVTGEQLGEMLPEQDREALIRTLLSE